uniref:Coatomer subunit zeta n=1 Tax=Mus musculus TaxID=10090 RepID=A0A2R8VJV3_MOUSE
MEALILEPSLYTVKAILILDNDGDRLFAKYYDDTYPSVKEQKAFEKNIFNKTHRTDSRSFFTLPCVSGNHGKGVSAGLQEKKIK